MTFTQMQFLLQACARLGLNTLGDLTAFKNTHNCRTNKELLAVLREVCNADSN